VPRNLASKGKPVKRVQGKRIENQGKRKKILKVQKFKLSQQTSGSEEGKKKKISGKKRGKAGLIGWVRGMKSGPHDSAGKGKRFRNRP